MEQSILTSTKKILGLNEDYEVFDLDIITHINSAFSTLNQLGVGPVEGFMIEDDTDDWEDYSEDTILLGHIKTYVFLKTRQLFDPPNTSYLITAMEKQIEQLEYRMSVYREGTEWVDPNVPVVEDV